VRYIFETIQSIRHEGFDCSFRDLQFTREIRQGFFSSFYFNCQICGMQEIVKSEQFDDNNINVNMAMVSSMMNMPNMSNKLYQDFHNSIFRHLNELA